MQCWESFQITLSPHFPTFRQVPYAPHIVADAEDIEGVVVLASVEVGAVESGRQLQHEIRL